MEVVKFPVAALESRKMVMFVYVSYMSVSVLYKKDDVAPWFLYDNSHSRSCNII